MNTSKQLRGQIIQNLLMANFTEAQAFCLADEIIDNQQEELPHMMSQIEQKIIHAKFELLKWIVGISIAQSTAIIGTLMSISMG